MSTDAFVHHFPTIGIYGRLPGVEIQTSVHAALWDMDWNVIFFGAAEFDASADIDYVIVLNTSGANELLKAADAAGVSGVTLCNEVESENWTIINLQGVEVYGSGQGKLTSTIKNAMKTGQVVVHGLPEDEVALVEQEDLAQTIALAMFEHIDQGPQGTIPAWGVDSKVVTLGEVAKIVFDEVNSYFKHLTDTQQAQFVPFVGYPIVSERLHRGNSFGRSGMFVVREKKTKKVIERKPFPEEPDAILVEMDMKPTSAKYFNNYSSLSKGVQTTIYRMASEGHKIEQPREARYALPRQLLFEMTHDKNYYDPNTYLLDS